jgi:uncharacterized membrane protein
LRLAAALLLIPVMADAGVAYDLAVRPVDENLNSLSAPAAPAVVTRYFVEDGQVRVENGQVRAGGSDAKMSFLFKDGTLFVIDHTAHIVHEIKHATLRQVLAHYADSVRQLEDNARNASPEEKAAADQKVADMRAVNDRLRQPVAREYRVTVRFESVDGHACRIWEEHEEGAKRLELCVAPVATIPGGAEILNGMKTLGQFREGSDFAFGVDFGLSDWWPDIAALNGVPLLVREYKYDSVVSESMLTSMRPAVPRAGQLDLPAGYAVSEGPDYVRWYLH